MGGVCPFGRGFERDSPRCRQCDDYIRAGTGTFFWCNHQIEQKSVEIEQKTRKIARKAAEIEQPAKKRGRPAGKAKKKAVKQRKNNKG